MPDISIATYSVIVRKKGEIDDRQQFGDHGFYEIADQFLSQLSNTEFAHSEKSIRVPEYQTSDAEQWIAGTIHGGESGFGSEFELNGVTEFERTPEHVEFIPHYFLIQAKDDERKGVLIVQKFGHRSMYSTFKRAFKKDFESRNQGFLLEFHPHVPSRIKNSLSNGRVKSLTMRRYKVTRDIADQYRIPEFDPEDAYVEISVRSRRFKQLPPWNWLNRLLTRESKYTEIAELNSDENLETVKAEIKFEGKTRVVNFRNLAGLSPTFSIGGEVAVDSDGHPVFDSIQRYALDLLSDLRAELGLDK